MKKMAVTIALSALFSMITVSNTEAWIATQNNSDTIAQLQQAFGASVVAHSTFGHDNATHVLYDQLEAARESFKSIAKAHNLKKDESVKIFKELLEKINKALKEIYQLEDSGRIAEDVNAAILYYNQHSTAYSSVKAKLGTNLQSFETAFNSLPVPAVVGTVNGNAAVSANNIFSLINTLKRQILPPAAPQPTKAPTTSTTNGNWMFNKPVQKPVAQQPAAAPVVTTPAVKPAVTAPAVKTTQPVKVTPAAPAPVVHNRGRR